MTQNRRTFLTQLGAGVAAARATQIAPAPKPQAAPAAIDFRYSPLSWQTAFCFPDDPHKSLAGERGELRIGHAGTGSGIDQFPVLLEFSLLGMEADRITGQQLEAPGVPIVHTHIDRPRVRMELIAFATNRPGEGRVDNVILELRGKETGEVYAGPVLRVTSREKMEPAGDAMPGTFQLNRGDRCFLLANSPFNAWQTGTGVRLGGAPKPVTGARPARILIRLPQEGQSAGRLMDGLGEPDKLLAEAREFWKTWRSFGDGVRWQLPGRYHEFLQACARNILQAREVKEGRKTFQVGPTVYRGLWVVDGNFLLESARYLGFDEEVQQGLEATWSHQQPSGAVVAAVGGKHWKDTAIAMFTMVRQAELGQDWSYFRKMTPNLLRAVKFLEDVREKGRSEDSSNGRYGLLARGFGDGGLGGERSEFTNTLWSLAGLKAAYQAGLKLGISEFESVRRFHDELRTSFFAAAKQEMRKHPAGFEFLPMLMKEDAAWTAPDEWMRPKPQNAQWALSQAIYPGLVFEKDDPIVRGHSRLMQASTREDVPIETGWLPHESLWTYNAAFVAHAYLWSGDAAWASRTFTGFLNHATPLYCWREEQPLRGALVGQYVGDMPHNWASAECLLYLRHIYALEDGGALRLLAGLTDRELVPGQPAIIEGTPTRFGRLVLKLTPAGSGGWKLEFSRADGPAPERVELPARLGSKARFTALTGAKSEQRGDKIVVDPAGASWSCTWKG